MNNARANTDEPRIFPPISNVAESVVLFLSRLVIGILYLTLLVGCALPPIDKRSTSQSLDQSQTASSRLGKTVDEIRPLDRDKSGIITLANPLDAFVARAVLADLSDHSLDVQYYIWQNDIAGKLLLRSLYEAAERGVKVRLLLDDNGIGGMDLTISAFDQHPNIEIRIFNPFVLRSFKPLGFITDFNRLNHRMHNKSFTADSQATIVGGRNIANEYFGSNSGALFADLDVLAVGPVAEHVARDFDRYWNSQSSYPAELLLDHKRDNTVKDLLFLELTKKEEERARRFIQALKQSNLTKSILDKKLGFEWVTVALISDDPAKILGSDAKEDRVSQQLSVALGTPESSVVLVSPYFVPRESGVDLFRHLEQQGVEVKILTNSLEANDVALVHSGYAKYRKSLLASGVELFEMRKLSEASLSQKVDPKGLIGSSSSSLHAKTFSVDGKTLFIGSFNFDPRSNHINTEMGLLIKSEKLASSLTDAFTNDLHRIAYQVKLDEEGNLSWVERNEGEDTFHDHDPNIGIFKRALVALLSLLPLDSLL